MKSNIQEEIIDLTELLGPSPHNAEASPASAFEGRSVETNPRRQVSAAATPMNSPMDEVAQPVCTELHSLINHLKLIEGALTQGRDIQRTVVVFKLIHQRALSLIGKIETLATQLGASHVTLRVALDTTGFALKHEVRRVYEVEAKGLCKAEGFNSHAPL